jgi:hypothetical protein
MVMALILREGRLSFMTKPGSSNNLKASSAAGAPSCPSSKGKVTCSPTGPFDDKSLPLAVGTLFELNNYSVSYGIHIHGAEIDIVARSKGDPFAPTIYIEVTVQYVDNTKFGKDTTKFVLVQAKDSGAKCLCISEFTPNVKERALHAGIVTQTYRELFSQFEKFSPYVDASLSSPLALSLIGAYEEPYFRDDFGEQLATDWLEKWISDTNPISKWLIVLGEYGTGKTALTIVLRHRWLKKYQADASSPIPIRIELRNFSRQFDARSLLHHFLDTNEPCLSG